MLFDLNPRRLFVPQIAVLFMLTAGACSAPGRHVERITGPTAEFVINVKGTADHRRMGGWKDDPGIEHNPTRFLTISNLGDRAVINPRVTVKGGPRWYDIDHIIGEFARPGMSDLEKSFALWQWIRHNLSDGPTFEGPLWGETRSMTRFMNTCGTGACGTYHIVMPVIGKQAGLDTFSGCFADCSHAVQREFFDGQERYLDAHIPHQAGQPGGWFALKLDNRELAGVDDIMQDRYLIDRAGGGPERFGYVAYFGPGCSFHKEKDRRDPHRMDLVLRPGERICWQWEMQAPPWKRKDDMKTSDRHGSGYVEFVPRLTEANVRQYSVVGKNIGFAGHGEATIMPADPSLPAELVYRLRCPYQMTRLGAGGQFEIAEGGAARVEFSFDGQEYHPLWREEGIGRHLMDAQVHEHPLLCEPKFTHEIWFRVTLEGAGTSVGQPRFRGDFQTYRPSLPSLLAGRNLVRYEGTFDTAPALAEGRAVRDLVAVEYRWLDLPDLPVPAAPIGPVYPTDGGRFGFNETLRWLPAAVGEGGTVDSYEVYISPREDLAWPVMPNTHRLTGSGEPAFELVMPDVLRDGVRYWWKVRGRSADGVWGEWSETWSFVASGPGAPTDLKVACDAGGGSTTLTWKPPKAGTPVDHYEIYASGEHGFSPLREAEKGDILGHIVDRPATLVDRTAETTWDASDRREVFYRVTAVDAEGNRGVPTPIVKAPSPALLPMALPAAVVDEPYAVTLPARLRTGRYALALRKGVIVDRADEPTFSLDSADRLSWLMIDPKEGTLSGRPEASAVGVHRVGVVLEDGRGDKCVREYDLRVVAGR